ncbi:glycosyltransferase [Methylococcus sp. ANG]|uniref:glycosyltransferase n=1 Tax=Methylococcus sp. ANG TaxID=3231903 RepID=UPI0034598E80
MNTTLALTLLAAVLLLWVGHTYCWQRRALRGLPLRPKPRNHPSITVIRPIKALDTGLEANVRAALDHGYPGPVETLFVFDDEREPAWPVVEKALAERGHADDTRVLFCGRPAGNRTGKLNAMIAGLRKARGELVAFVDSDVRQDRDALRTLVDTLLGTACAGAAFAPVVATAPPLTVGDAGYALMINGLYEPAAIAAAADRGGELPFIMGEFMAFKREAIAAIGGLETADGQLVDDMFLGHRLNEYGYRNVMSSHPVAIIQQGASLHEFLPILVRWLAFSRSGLPVLAFKLHHWLVGGAFWAGLAIALVAAGRSLPLVAVLSGSVPIAVGWMIHDLHVRLGGAPLPWSLRWVGFALWLTAPLIYARALTRTEIDWRGRRYRLDPCGRLDCTPATLVPRGGR